MPTLIGQALFTGGPVDINGYTADLGFGTGHRGEADANHWVVNGGVLTAFGNVFGGNGYGHFGSALGSSDSLELRAVGAKCPANNNSHVGICIRANNQNGASPTRQFIRGYLFRQSAGLFTVGIDRIHDGGQAEVTNFANIALPADTTGVDLILIAQGAVITIATEPSGGGARTVHGQHVMATTYNDAAHRHIGLSSATQNSAHNAVWADLTMLQLNQAPTPVVVVAPVPGEYQAADGVEVEFTAASDPDDDDLTYEGQYSLNGGSDWLPLFALQAGLTYVWDTSGVTESDEAMVRVRAFDGELYSEWAESELFSLLRTWHQVARPAGTWADEARPTGSWVQV